MDSSLTIAYLRWAFIRATLARGWWLTTAVYLVTVADLSPAQLVLIGVFQGLTVVVAEVPAGVLADTVSRRLALVVAHVVMGAGMALTGFVTDYSLIVLSQCLWGLGWAISSGADVAWITEDSTARLSSTASLLPRAATTCSATRPGSSSSARSRGPRLCRQPSSSPASA